MERCNSSGGSHTVRVSIVTNKFKILRGNEAGVTLIETVVALAILGIVAVIFLSSMSTAFTLSDILK